MTVAQITLEGLEDIAFTETQLKILDVLRDGEPHHKREIHACLPDDLGAMSNIHPHISTIRNKIREPGYLILITFKGYSPHYQLVRSI